MKQYQIPQTDLKVSRLAYGTWHLGGSWDKTPLSDDLKKRAVDLISAATEHNINHIDLADIYTLGKSDMLVGHALKSLPGLREKVVLQGKSGIIVGGDENFGPPGRYDASYDHLLKSVETTLKRLGTDYLDILALHRPDPLMEGEEIAKVFDHLHSQGMVRYFGVSNHSAAQIQYLKRYLQQPLILNQLELNLLHHDLITDGILVNMHEDGHVRSAGLLDYCRLHDIMIQAWSPLAGGAYLAPKDDAPENVSKLAQAISNLAEIKNTTKDAIALAWLLRHPMGIQPILGTLKAFRIADAVKADEISLSRVEWYSLLEAARGKAVP